MIPDSVSDFAYPWPLIGTPIAQKNPLNGGLEQPGEHQARHPRHKQILKSP
jgi:hypothetical protein